MDRYPNRHTGNDRPPCVKDELAKCNIESRKKLHNKRMNRETKATLKGSFIKIHLAMSKGTCIFVRTR